ncbi:MAG: hypothetical protein HY868_17780 [Chloroflexi bacterium]|nr:hypothetical protein [Chloroflexota bacterium]
MTDERFENAEREFFKLKGQFAAGRITSEQFDRALKELIVEDAQGRFWMLGADSGTWYIHDGQSWVEATPPGVTQREPRVAPTPPPPTPQPQAQPQGSCRARAILGTVVGGLLTLGLGLAVTWGQGALRTAFLGAGTTPSVVFVTATPLPQINTPPPVKVLSPVVVVVTATTLPSTSTPTRTNTPTSTLTNTPVARTPTATATPSPIVVPTFPASVLTWSSGYDKTVGTPLNVVANKTFSARPLEIYATWNPTGVPAGTKLQTTWYYNGAFWAQGEYVLQAGDDSVWHSVFRQDGQPLASGTYRMEIKVGNKIILTDEARVLNP